MWLIIFGIVMAVILVIVLAIWSEHDCEWYNTVAASISLLLGFATGIVLICMCFVAWNWTAAEHKAKIINREYRTEYTQEEVFYGSDVIDTIRQLDRKRIEINGDILKDK
jgi:glucan phosphoethanolaminetransferase (alkaline phosphatase superfamily)